MKNDFLDEIIKDKLNQQSYEFTQADWVSFESKQTASSATGGSGLKWLLGGAAAITVIAIASYFLLSEQNFNSSSNEKGTQIANQTNQSVHDENTTIEDNTNNTVNSDNIISNNTSDKDEANTSKTTGINQNNHTNPTENNTNNTLTNVVSNENNDQKEVASNESSNTETTTHNGSTSKEVAIPSAVIMSGNLSICPGESVAFETIEQSDVIYSWSFGDNTYSNNRNISHTYNNPGKYAVSLIVTSTIDHSVLSKSKDVLVEVLPAPNTNFEIIYLEDEIMPSVQMVSSEMLPSYYWDFGDGTNSTEASPVKSFKRKGYYNITLTSKNHEGCKASTSHKAVIKEDYNLLAPNSFTPNGDGINDFFIPEALKTMDVEFTMNIYSQNEGLIFESKNINQQWDGRNQQNGTNCGEGTYIWVVSLVNSQGKSEQYKGAVLLLNK